MDASPQRLVQMLFSRYVRQIITQETRKNDYCRILMAYLQLIRYSPRLTATHRDSRNLKKTSGKGTCATVRHVLFRCDREARLTHCHCHMSALPPARSASVPLEELCAGQLALVACLRVPVCPWPAQRSARMPLPAP